MSTLTVTGTVTNSAGLSAPFTGSITIQDNPPVIGTLTQTPNPAIHGQSVQFTIPATDPQGLTLTWNNVTVGGQPATPVAGQPGTFTYLVP